MDLTHKTMKRRAAERAAKVQDYKRANPDATLDEMARVFKVSRETVRTDLLKVAADVRGEGGNVLSPDRRVI
jgi:DeoR/GlpR family transcriptional regulator of sugar metabolism